MKKIKLSVLLVATAMMASFLNGCTGEEKKETAGKSENVSGEIEFDNNDIGAFRPVDCGIPTQPVYEYPFIGLEVTLSSNMMDYMNERDVFLYTNEDYADATSISYAQLRFSAVTAEQKAEEVMSLDIISWEENLEKIGIIGIYDKNMVLQLDSLTNCDNHKKIGDSTDGRYEYYLSTNSGVNADYISELEKTQILITEIHQLDPSLGYTAFSTDRVEGISNVGEFETTDVFGNIYNQDFFKDYDLTLVNVFTTWCSPCVNEMPELEKLRKEYEDKGIKLGVVAVVLDSKTVSGIDDTAVEQAKVLCEKSGAEFPFIIPDETNMNGRLTGIESVPESFFVDKDGNIVSEPYIGANSKADWVNIVDSEFEKLNGGN